MGHYRIKNYESLPLDNHISIIMFHSFEAGIDVIVSFKWKKINTFASEK